MNTPAPFLLPFLRQTQHLHFLRRECFLHILLNFKVPNRASRVLKKSELSATFHCLSYSYPPSKCKCNERVLHLSDVAMHVDTCLPQPFLHCPLPIATFAEMNSILLCFMWDCLPKPPLPPPAPPPSPHLFTSVARAFICTSHTLLFYSTTLETHIN